MLGLSFIVAISAAFSDPYSVPKEQLDPKKVYWGTSASFERAGEIDYERAIKVTPEYEQISKDKIERGTGKYWILLSQASDRVVRTIARVGQDANCDLIASRGYLASLNPPIPAEDVTQVLLDNLQGKAKTAKKK